MAITNYQLSAMGNVTVVTVTSDLEGTVYFHWYVDGAYVASTTAATWSVFLEPGEEVRLEAKDTDDPDFDPIANAPVGYPGRRTLFWLRALATDVEHYRVEMQKDGGGWSTVAIVRHDENEWSYRVLSPRLEDLTPYEFRVVPVDDAGNDGTAIAVAAETVVRWPDGPDFTISYASGTQRVTFSEAA